METARDRQAASTVDEIAEILRERIIEGRLPAGASLTQRRLAEDLSVSRAAAGEALRMLGREGLVDAGARPGRVVPADSMALRSALAVREAIDGLAAALAARDRGPVMERRCRGALEDLRSAARTDNRPRIVRADIAFHEALVEGSGNPALRRHWLLVRFTTRTAMLLPPAQAARAIADHEAILVAVNAGDPERAERAARAHTRATGDALVALAQPAPPTPDVPHHSPMRCAHRLPSRTFNRRYP
jgi:DNA-binding GntR family transcriptional regulator